MAKQKQVLTPYQKQIRFLTCFLGTLMVLTATGLIWLFNNINFVGRGH